MSFFQKFTTFLKTRLTVIPRSVMSSAKKLGLTAPELDIVCKLLNFNIDGEICPEIEELAKKAGISSKTLQRATSSLEKKGYLVKSPRRGKDGRVLPNAYDFSSLWEKLNYMTTGIAAEQMSLFNQMDLDMNDAGMEDAGKKSIFDRFGKYAKSLLSTGFIFIPRNLDEFQKELSITTHEMLFIKYAFGYMDETGISSISLNVMVKHIPISKSTATSIVSELSKKGYIGVQGQKLLGRKWKNAYDLAPLVKILEKLEKRKIKTKLIAQDRWKTFRRISKKTTAAPEMKTPEVVTNNPNAVKKEEIKRLDMEIAILKSQHFGKDSETAEDIREYERQRSEVIGNEKTTETLADLLKARMEGLRRQKPESNETQLEHEARRVCEIVKGNFQKDRNFYIKAVKTFPRTINYFITTAVESAGKSSERYFAKMVAAKFREISNS